MQPIRSLSLPQITPDVARRVLASAAFALISVALAVPAVAHQPREWVPWVLDRDGDGIAERNFCPRPVPADVYDPGTAEPDNPWVRCWVNETRFQDEVNDYTAGPDASYGSSATPAHADIYSGPAGAGTPGEQASFFYAWDPAALCSTKTFVSSSDGLVYPYADTGGDCGDPVTSNGRGIFYVAMRLRETPTLNATPTPGENVSGPFKSSVAWNFIFETNGDGFGDFILSVDGNQGSNDDCDIPGNKCFDNQVLARNVPGRGDLSQPSVQEPNQYFNEHVKTADDPKSRLCTQSSPEGDILVSHDANRFNDINQTKPPIPGCATNRKGICDFGITQTLNVDGNDCIVSGVAADGIDDDGNACNNATPPYDATHGSENFILMMQTPLDWFDNCEGGLATDADGDGLGGDQVLYPESPFSICLTTSTQPNDFTLKDLGFEGDFRMDPLTPLVCTDSCRLASGCQQEPIIADMTASCNDGSTPDDHVRIVAEVLDTTTTDGTTVSDSIDTVEFLYAQDDGSGNPILPYQPIGLGENSGVIPPDIDTQINTWFVDWNIALIPSTPSSLYYIMAIVTDDQGNTTQLVPIIVNVTDPNCETTANPVTLADFGAERDGSATRFDWTTAAEVGNLAFNILVPDGAGGYRALNDEPIPASGRDRVEPQHYTFEAYDVEATEFVLEDLSVEGEATRHGPFGIEENRQKRPALALDKIDWKAIKAASPPARPFARNVALASNGKGKGGGANKETPASIELLVDEPGLYRLTYEDLLAEGIDLAGVNAGHLAVTNGGRAVPIRVGGGKAFGPGSFVELVGETVSTLYTDTNVYVLTVAPRNAKRVAEERATGAGAPGSTYQETTRFERQRQYSFATPTGDPWFDTSMVVFRDSPRQWSFDFTVDGLVPGAGATSLRIDLWGITNWFRNPDHHVRAMVNGQQIADELFDGLTAHTLTAELPPGLLQDGPNELTLELLADLGDQHDVVYLDAFEVTYPRAFEARDGRLRFTAAGSSFEVTGVSGDAVVYRLDGDEATVVPTSFTSSGALAFPGSGVTASYVVSEDSALQKPLLREGRALVDITSGTADYLMISHGDFLAGLEPLVSAREAEGLMVKVVDVADVYAQFGHGIFGAEAIQEYIRRVAPDMGLSYVLLVGGDTYDYHDHLGLGSISFVPSLYGRTDDLISHAPLDPMFADLDGDSVQDLAIGRFPVRTRAELDLMVEKTLLYASKGYEHTALFAADKYDLVAEMSYSSQSEQMVRQLPETWNVTRAYADADTVAATKQIVVDTINDGVALTTWLGHSGPTLWSLSRIFTASDAARLENERFPTVVVQWGCWNTYHVSPYYNTMGHTLLLSGYQGAAAVLGSATLSSAESDVALGKRLVPWLSTPGVTIGQAMVAAKQELAATGATPRDVMLGWTLLGDPALRIDP